MGADKANLPIPGGTLIGRVLRQVERMFDEILISVSKGQGSMAGILAGLEAAKNDGGGRVVRPVIALDAGEDAVLDGNPEQAPASAIVGGASRPDHALPGIR